MEPYLREALDLWRAMFDEAPDQANLWVYLPVTYRHLGEAQYAGGKHAEALATARAGLRWLQENPFITQGHYKFRVDMAYLILNVVRHAEPGTPFGAEAVELLRQTAALLPERANSAPDEDKLRTRLRQRLDQLRGTQPAPP